MITELLPHALDHGWVEDAHPRLSAKYEDTHAYFVCPCGWKGTVRLSLLPQLGVHNV